MAHNGMASYSIHAANVAQLDEIRALKEETAGLGFGVDAGAEAVDPETAARQHLTTALNSANLPAYTCPAVEGLYGEFKLVGTETVELTGTTTVKFRQTFNKVPVYGSLVTVELDDANNLIGLNSALAAPEGVSPIAEIAPAAALRAISEAGGAPDPNTPGRPHFYLDRRSEPFRWRLCYLVEDVPLAEPEDGYGPVEDDDPHGVGRLPAAAEHFFVDAHSGEIVARLPRAADASAAASQVSALDELDTPRTIRVSPETGTVSKLYDPDLNIHTFDLNFADAAPGPPPQPTYCANPPDWKKGAVSAHANAAVVCDFLRNVLKRRGVDNKGGPLRSSIRCSYRTPSPGTPQPWLNAMWSRGEMFYGQRPAPSGDGWICLAVDLEIVAHEIAHGLTEASANLDYWFETGALNESYSDIFGVIVANYDVRDRAQWDYRIGRNFRGTGAPLRSLADPAAYGQPDHMDDYRHLLLTQDNGGVHINSGIHNKAAHAIFTALDASGSPLFSAAELAGIFYLSLTQHLTRTSFFTDSRRGVELSAMTLLRQLPPSELEERIAAIRAAFDSVGIR